MSQETQITGKQTNKYIKKSCYRNKIYRNTEIQIAGIQNTDIPNSKLQKYRNTNVRNKEIKIKDIQITKIPKYKLKKSRNISYRPGTDHVISGPMRCLNKNCILWGRQINKQTNKLTDRRTLRRYD